MDILTIVLSGAIVGAFVGGFSVAIKKTNAAQKELENKLTEEQKMRLAEAQPRFEPGKDREWTQEALVCKMIDKGNRYHIKLLWHNKVIQNATLNELQIADTKLSKEDADTHNVREGSFVTLWISPEKASCKIVF